MNVKEFKNILTQCKYFECWADMIQSGFVYGRPLMDELREKDIEVCFVHEDYTDEDFSRLILGIGSPTFNWADFCIEIRYYRGSYSQHTANDFLNMEEVKPVTKTITVYEKVRSRE